MIAVAIVPLLLTATAATTIPSLPLGTGQDQAVQVRLDESGNYYPGHDARVDVRTESDGYLLVLQVDPEGRLRVLFPLEPFDDAFVEGGRKYDLVDRGGRGSFYVDDVDGVGAVFAAHSDWPFHLNAFATDRRWDYQALRIPSGEDVEKALVDLVARVTYDGWFEYDIVEYEVYGEGSYSGGARYTSYTGPYINCCRPTYGVSVYVGDYYPYGYPWYFSSYWYYPPYYNYRPYYVYRPYYGYPYYRDRYRSGHYYAGGYPRGRDYRFKAPYRYDRNRSSNAYRPRIGVDAGRQLAGGADYRRRTSPSVTPVNSPRRRTSTAAATAGRSSSGSGLRRPSGRVGSRRTDVSPSAAGRSRTAGRTQPRSGDQAPQTGRRTRPRSGDRASAPRNRADGSRSPSASRPRGRRTATDQPVLKRAEPNGGSKARGRSDKKRPERSVGGRRSPSSSASRPRTERRALDRPVLKRAKPSGGSRARSRSDTKRPGRSVRGGRTPSSKASRPRSQPSRSRASRPSAPTRRPQARSGGSTRRASGRSPSRPQVRSRGSSRRKP